MIEPTELHAAFRERLPALLSEIEKLVNIDSGSYFAPGVTEVARWVGRRLEAIGFSVSFEAVPSRGDRLVAVRSGGGRGRLMILGHADTVWPNGTVAEWPFAITGDRATGPGVGDMKAGLVMALHALDILGKRGALNFETIRYVLVCDEELGSPACRSWIEDHARQSDWVLVLEPTRPGGGMITSRGAVGAFFITARGVSAHAAVDYGKGVSAVRPLAKIVGPLEALTDLDAGVIVTVGRFDGGTARQVIPENATLHLDVRARTPEQQRAVQAAIESLVAEANEGQARVTLSGGWTRPSWPANPGGAQLYQYAKHTSDILGVTTFEMPTVSGGSDGSFCGALGIPTLDAMGPECHDVCSRRETIPVASVADRGAILASVIARLSAQ
jgi:acetylornithine deacetylase/succinyl-diaminopimelate desuccinylase-like protein